MILTPQPLSAMFEELLSWWISVQLFARFPSLDTFRLCVYIYIFIHSFIYRYLLGSIRKNYVLSERQTHFKLIFLTLLSDHFKWDDQAVENQLSVILVSAVS